MKSAMFFNGKDDLTDQVAETVLRGQSTDGQEKAAAATYEFLMMSLGYSESLASAASGYEPPQS